MVSPSHPVLQISDNSYALGCCDKLTRKIYINDMLNVYYMKKVLCHEIVHAAMFSYDVVLSYEEEEMIAEIIDTYGEEIIEITEQLFKNMIR